MKKLLALILTVLCLLSLCACGNDVTANPLITVPETDDPLYVSDRGILHVEGAFVVKANFLVDEGGGNYQPRTEGGISLPAVSLSPQTTGLTVGHIWRKRHCKDYGNVRRIRRKPNGWYGSRSHRG